MYDLRADSNWKLRTNFTQWWDMRWAWWDDVEPYHVVRCDKIWDHIVCDSALRYYIEMYLIQTLIRLFLLIIYNLYYNKMG